MITISILILLLYIFSITAVIIAAEFNFLF